MVTTNPGPRSPHKSRGAVAVELALVLPILVLLVFGIIEFGRGYHAKAALAHAAREAVREAALDIGDPATIATTARNAAPLLDGASMTVTIEQEGAVVAGSCVNGKDVTVTLTYPHQYDIPLFGAGTWNLTEIGVMRCGG